jgi:hypothetical protein
VTGQCKQRPVPLHTTEVLSGNLHQHIACKASAETTQEPTSACRDA